MDRDETFSENPEKVEKNSKIYKEIVKEEQSQFQPTFMLNILNFKKPEN